VTAVTVSWTTNDPTPLKLLADDAGLTPGESNARKDWRSPSSNLSAPTINSFWMMHDADTR
jgi:hypothetical protein